MSGWVLAHGQAEKKDVDRMFAKIVHRGPYLKGIMEEGPIIMAQNYLEGDVRPGNATASPPVKASGLAICYDGEIGNWKERAGQAGTAEGPFHEERLVLDLFRKHGKEVFRFLDDAVFAFAIFDGKDLFAARDLLGIKTLFYGSKEGTIYFASELKSILEVTEEVREFPPGHYMDESGAFHRYADLPKAPPPPLHTDPDRMIKTLREIISRSLLNRARFDVPTGSLLSGGIDSSVIAHLASSQYREIAGAQAKLMTFALGVGESEDIRNAREVAQHIGSEHHELIVTLEDIVGVLPQVIYHLESFDPSLVRSSVSNYLISKYAADRGIKVLLSGEGGDELFCGYTYLKQVPMQELFLRQMECLGYLHNNASLRLDRMNLCHSVRVVAPLISGELLAYAMAIPAEYKQKPNGDERTEKWIFRKAFEGLLPDSIVWRLKQEFSQGSGSADVMPGYFEDVITDDDFAQARSKYPFIRSKEELHYFNIFVDHFGSGPAVQTVGQWVSL